MRTCSRSHVQVTPQDGRLLVVRYFDQAHGLASAMPQYGVAVRGPDIAHPVHVLAEHRDEIAFAVAVGDDDWE